MNRQSDRRKNGNIMNDEKHLDPEFQISRYLDGDMGDAGIGRRVMVST